MQDNGSSLESTPHRTAGKQRLPTGVPFKKGDPRINRGGRPRSFDQFRELARQIAAGVAEGETTITVGEKILRDWSKSKKPQLQRAFIEYAFGRVPDKLDTSGLETKTTLILHYGHEREKRDQDPSKPRLGY